VPGHEADVHLRWDDWGTPHIEAPTEALAAFGMGYAQASLQLTELLGQFLLVRSELSTVVGPAAVPLDAEQLRWQVLDRARADYAVLDPVDLVV
jgi:penicillin amidase